MCHSVPAWAEPAFELGVAVASGALMWLLAALLARRLTAPLERLGRAAERFDPGSASAFAVVGNDSSVEVGSLRASFEPMAVRARSRVEAQHNLLAVIGHELKSPLARIQVHVDLAREGIQRQAQFCDIETEIAELTQLVDDLLAVARTDFGALAHTAVDLAEAARRAVGDRPVAIVGTAAVGGDPTLLVRLLAILVDNAHRHGAAPIVITLTTGASPRVTVDDDGPGFGPDPNRLLEPFERGNKDSTGIGLGLALATRIVEAQGGSLTLGTSPGGGARVTLVLSASPSSCGND